MTIWILAGLGAVCAAMLFVERVGRISTPRWQFRGDLQRETQWFQQYGQLACTAMVSILIWQMHAEKRLIVFPLMLAVGGSALLAMLLKRLLGRVRPGREHAGRFLGPSWTHAN